MMGIMVRLVLEDVPQFLVAGLGSVSQMEELPTKGHADCVSMYRPLIREPRLVTRIEERRAEAASCVSCNCCLAAVAK